MNFFVSWGISEENQKHLRGGIMAFEEEFGIDVDEEAQKITSGSGSSGD